VAVAIIGVMLKIAVPSIQNSLLAYRLGAAASSAAAAIQQTRYLAIRRGCSYTITFTAGSTTYQVQTQDFTNATPPACVTNGDGSPAFSSSGNVPTSWTIAPVSWTSGGGINVGSSPTLQFSPGGIVGLPPGGINPLVPCAPNCSFQLSNGNATRTVTISGVGNVKVTSP